MQKIDFVAGYRELYDLVNMPCASSLLIIKHRNRFRVLRKGPLSHSDAEIIDRCRTNRRIAEAMKHARSLWYLISQDVKHDPTLKSEFVAKTREPRAKFY